MLFKFNFGQKYLFTLPNEVTIETTQNLLMARFQIMLFGRVLRKV